MHPQKLIEGVLSYTCFGLHGFGYTHHRKMINSYCIQLYMIFGRAQAKIVRFTTPNSVIHDFWACSSENCSIYNAIISYT